MFFEEKRQKRGTKVLIPADWPKAFSWYLLIYVHQPFLHRVVNMKIRLIEVESGKM